METEERARLMGWVPKEEFKGDPEKWTEAESWVERADTVMPIMKSQMGKYEEQLKSASDELKATKSEIANLKETMSKIVKVNAKVSEREYNRALETLRKEQESAINDGDGAKFRQLEEDKARLELNRPEEIQIDTPTPEQSGETPQFKKWKQENDWYEKDETLQAYADGVAHRLIKNTPKFQIQANAEELMDMVKREVQNTFPSKFENPNRNEANDVMGGEQHGGTPPKKNTYNSLPAEAKAACDATCAAVGGDKEIVRKQWVKDYFEE